eukprot:Pompholyxophrys_punicea_v1_NODE_2_length_10808_cov_35.677950.p7 type:complete len:134 gc:universal NODE_2_length_10808_cov_35.677950:5050-5451(+)
MRFVSVDASASTPPTCTTSASKTASASSHPRLLAFSASNRRPSSSTFEGNHSTAISVAPEIRGAPGKHFAREKKTLETTSLSRAKNIPIEHWFELNNEYSSVYCNRQIGFAKVCFSCRSPLPVCRHHCANKSE